MKSHQEDDPPCPYQVVVDGNALVDLGCEAARTLPRPADVHMPTGGLFAHIVIEGRMVTGSITTAIRERLRAQALAEENSALRAAVDESRPCA